MIKEHQIHLGGTARSPEDVNALHELGLQFAEIPITDPDKFYSLKDDYNALRKQLGLYYICHGPQEGDANDTETLEKAYLPKLMHILSIMPELDMKLLTLHLWMDARFVSQEAIAYKMDLLKRLSDKAKKEGIIICLENLSERSSHLAEIFQALPFLGLTMDLGHGQLLAREHTSFGFMHHHPERIMHIHLHDNRGGLTADDDLHLPVGDGIIDFEKIFQMLKQIEYKGTITLELIPHEIKKCLGYVKKLLEMKKVKRFKG